MHRRCRGGGDAGAMPVADAPPAPPFACVGSAISGSGGASTRGAGGGGAGRSTCRSTERPSSSLSSSSLSIGLPLGAFWGNLVVGDGRCLSSVPTRLSVAAATCFCSIERILKKIEPAKPPQKRHWQVIFEPTKNNPKSPFRNSLNSESYSRYSCESCLCSIEHNFQKTGDSKPRTALKWAVHSHSSHISTHPDRPGVYSNAPLSVAELGKWVKVFGEIVTSALNFSLVVRARGAWQYRRGTFGTFSSCSWNQKRSSAAPIVLTENHPRPCCHSSFPRGS